MIQVQQKQMITSQMKVKRIKMRIASIALAFGLLISACSKDEGCKNVPVADEDAALVAYNTAHAITATKHPKGLYYQIIDPGNSSKPVYNSTVYVKYVGKTLDDVVFDEQTSPGIAGFYLPQLIEGWQIGIPLIGKGGRILLTIPSALAYGCQGAPDGTLQNAPLYFEIDLVDFH